MVYVVLPISLRSASTKQYADMSNTCHNREEEAKDNATTTRL